MFSNIGGKIKTLAEILCWSGIVLSIGLGFLIVWLTVPEVDEMMLLWWLFGLPTLGSLFSWVGSLVLYGFGQLVENSDILAQQWKTDTDKQS